METNRIPLFVALSACACFFNSVAHAQVMSAQSCPIPGLTVGGYYTFSAIGAGAPGSLLAGGGTSTSSAPATAATSSYSSTELGQLLGGAAGTGAFAASGTLYLDGVNSVLAFASPTAVISTPVGGYLINANCSITVTLTDAFGTNNTPISFQGVILNNGAEIDLGVLQNLIVAPASGSSPYPATGASGGLYGSNMLVKLVRTASVTCGYGNLSGSYSLVASGTRVVNQMEAPFFMLAVAAFDGGGNIVPPSSLPGPFGGPSAQSYLELSGTYTVNPDCTGTMTLNIPGPANATLSLSFVLTPPNVPVDQATLSGARSLPLEIQFSESGPTGTISGYGVVE